LRRESVPSDGALTKVVLFRHTLPAKFVYEVAAEKSKFAFLRTKLKNATRSPFLAAPVSVFLGSDFVGESRLATCAPNEEFTVGLGADEQVAVARRVETKRDTRGVIGTAYRFSVGIEAKVKNGKTRPVTVVVYERLPYTWDEELKVSKGTFKPKPTDVKYLHEHLEDRPVLMRWELTLAPGEEKKVTVAYWFQHAADRRVLFNEDNSVAW